MPITALKRRTINPVYPLLLLQVPEGAMPITALKP